FPAPTRAPLVADAGTAAGKAVAAASPPSGTRPGMTPLPAAAGDRPWQLTARTAGALTDIGAALRAVKPVETKPSALIEVTG
ncbi:hypothetical protein J8J40_32815, partial [Mycobacterium tuberculosis]|nr:hypothetical protein [Mycobacterium tuberculosis]